MQASTTQSTNRQTRQPAEQRSRRLANLVRPGVWRPLLAALAVFVGIAAAVVFTWHQLESHQEREQQHRFDLNIAALSEILKSHMQSYETVLRGVSSAFVGDGEEIRPQVSRARWDEIIAQLQLPQLYPGISSVAWSRRLRDDELGEFVALVRADGRPGYRMFPDGAREAYQIIEHIGPVTPRTQSVLGLDLLTQPDQQQAIMQAVDSGQATLSQPIPDLYDAATPGQPGGVGAMMYLPLYQHGRLPQTPGARRALLVGAINVVFRGDLLVTNVFGTRLRLFRIVAHDMDTGLQIFDSAMTPTQAQSQTRTPPPPGWQPELSAQTQLSFYGRTWRLSVASTPEYEQALLSRSQDLVLLMGLSTALLVALLAGAFVWQRDQQVHAQLVVEAKLRDQAEQLMLANRYKSEFLANMSHELRTPLNSILILSDQLRQNSGGNLNQKQTRHADIVYRAGSDLLQLINDVLDLAKVEAGRMQLTMEPLNLQDLLVDLDASMRPLAEAKKLHLYIPPVTPDSGVPSRVFTDRVRLHQILRNLLSNAIKFTDQGQINVSISAGETLPGGSQMLHFVVRDTGIGIDPAYHPHVFEAFRQFDGSTRRRHGGTGLGLAITQQLVHALDGEIALQSALGQGSTFTVSLPMQAVPALPDADIQAPQRAGSGRPLLVVEDDANFAAVIVAKAHDHGFASVHCVTGQQALELLKNESFAAVVLDILLPDISGWQLFRRLRALPGHRHTPVHIISCLPQPDGLDEHGTHYLTKPLARDALEQAFASLKDDADTARAPTLLLIEDVEAEREHYRQQLSDLGFAVTACESANEAQAVWPGGQFDVLVTDLNLPDQDGLSLLASLDAQRPLAGTRVVVNTGLDVNHEGLQRLRGYSAVVVHKKGDDTAMLGQAVQGFLGSISTAVNGYAVAASQPGAPDPVPSAPDAASSPADAAAGSTADAAAVSTPPRADLNGRRLLLVDDDIRNVYAMSALLDDFGLSIATAGNGEEAIASFLQNAPDVILMDMSMPVMDGYVATNLLKTEHGCTVPIIALTAHAMKGDREKCLAAGADDYISKPVDRVALRAILERWLAAGAPTAVTATAMPAAAEGAPPA